MNLRTTESSGFYKTGSPVKVRLVWRYTGIRTGSDIVPYFFSRIVFVRSATAFSASFSFIQANPIRVAFNEVEEVL